MKLHAIANGIAVFTSDNGQIISEPITHDAKMILDWFYKRIPANEY